MTSPCCEGAHQLVPESEVREVDAPEVPPHLGKIRVQTELQASDDEHVTGHGLSLRAIGSLFIRRIDGTEWGGWDGI